MSTTTKTKYYEFTTRTFGKTYGGYVYITDNTRSYKYKLKQRKHREEEFAQTCIENAF